MRSKRFCANAGAIHDRIHTSRILTHTCANSCALAFRGLRHGLFLQDPPRVRPMSSQSLGPLEALADAQSWRTPLSLWSRHSPAAKVRLGFHSCKLQKHLHAAKGQANDSTHPSFNIFFGDHVLNSRFTDVADHWQILPRPSLWASTASWNILSQHCAPGVPHSIYIASICQLHGKVAEKGCLWVLLQLSVLWQGLRLGRVKQGLRQLEREPGTAIANS